MNRRVAVRGIIIHDGKLFCVKQKPYAGSVVMKNPYWCTPGGGLDEGEALAAGLERELFEETGVHAKVGNLLYIQQFLHNGREHMELFFFIENSADFLAINLAETSHGTDEIEEFAFIDPAVANILPEFLRSVSLMAISGSEPVKVFNYLS